MHAADTVRAALKRAGDRAVDGYFGIETATRVTHDGPEFGASRGGKHYEATNWMAVLWVRHALERFRPRLDESFVEFGAGKGRVVLVVATLPFGSVTGVELSPSLARAARANIARATRPLASPVVSIVEGDMGVYEIPDDLAVAYFYNPSKEPAFREAVSRIAASLDRRPRRFRLIYGNPVKHDVLLEMGFHVVHRPRFLNWNVYAYK